MIFAFVIRRCCFICIVNIACDREDCELRLVEAVVRTRAPVLSNSRVLS